MPNSSYSIGKKTVMTALFAALISAGCFIHIPLPGGVPITVQDMMAMLSGLLLGPLYGSASVLIFLILEFENRDKWLGCRGGEHGEWIRKCHRAI